MYDLTGIKADHWKVFIGYLILEVSIEIQLDLRFIEEGTFFIRKIQEEVVVSVEEVGDAVPVSRFY